MAVPGLEPGLPAASWYSGRAAITLHGRAACRLVAAAVFRSGPACLRWWWELLVRWSLMNPWFAGGAVAQVQWSNGGRCSGPGEEVRIGRGGKVGVGACVGVLEVLWRC